MQLKEAKSHLKTKGWTQRAAAVRFNITESYLSRVLKGELKSQRLLKAIAAIEENPNPTKRPSYE